MDETRARHLKRDGPDPFHVAHRLEEGMDAAPPQHKTLSTPVTSGPLAMAPILIVDDDDPSRLLIEASLSALRLANPVVMACDGDDAVQQLQPCLRNEALVPVLVMLDGQMPGRSGLEVLRWMREQPALRDVPVIMLTGMSDMDSIQDAYSSGAASYLVKPVAFEALADVIRGLHRPWVLL
jgi:CheY-like chemotaxis protein